MWPFGKKPEQPAEDREEVERLEIEGRTAMFIQQKAQVGTLFAQRLDNPDENYAAQRAHYESVRDDLIAHLETIHDDFYRNFASRMLIRMLMAAKDEAVARAVLISVNNDDIREKILDDCPELALSRMKTLPIRLDD